jgi:hypothetical protein
MPLAGNKPHLSHSVLRTFLGKSEYVLRCDLMYSMLDIVYELAGINAVDWPVTGSLK